MICLKVNITNKLNLVFYAAFLFLSVKAEANPCSLVGGGIMTYHQTATFDSEDNFAGYETGDIPSAAPGSYNIGGLCSPKHNAFWSASMADGMVDKGNGWFAPSGGASEYLQMKLSTAVYDAANKTTSYKEVPFVDFNNRCSQNPSACGGDATTGSKIKLDLKIVKPFVGFEHINQLVAFISANNNVGESARNPIVQIYLDADITVPQSCELDGGTTITMDFGNIAAQLFPQAGAGNKPETVNPKTHSIAVKCKNMDAQALLSMRLESDNVSGNAMVSDNKDVGFVVADSNKVPLVPNNLDSKIKFQLDENFSANVPITVWPVSITGDKPAEGRFTAEGYLRIDFD